MSRIRRHSARIACLALVAVAPAAHAEQLSELEVPTRDGDVVHVEIARPDGDAKVPIILTYSPYDSLAGSPASNLASGSPWVAKGYARAIADVIGTRDSTGCWDYGGPREQRSGVDLVAALARQPWSNGRVGMTGVSYEGTTATMVAAAGDVPGLAAIVPVAAISRWYGYAYQDGVRYLGNSQVPTDEGIDTPLGFDLGFGRTPPDRLTSAQALAARLNPCDAVDHTLHAYSTTPDYDAFWLARDYRKDAARIRVPVMVVHGWQDYNVKQSEGLDLYDAIPVDDPATPQVEGVPFKLLHLEQAPHADGSGDGYTQRLDAFFARTLKGEQNGIEYEDAVRTQGRTRATPGAFTHATQFPPLGTFTEHLRLGGAGELAPTVPATPAEATFTDLGLDTEEAAIAVFPAVLPGQLLYRTAPLDMDTRLAGSAVLHARVRVDGDTGQLSPTLLDIPPSGAPVAISRGHLNLQYRNGLASHEPVPAGKDVDVSVRLAPQDQTVPKGDAIGLLVASSNLVWALPDTGRRTVTLVHGASTLDLPVVGPPPAAAAPPPAPARPPARRLFLTAHLTRVPGKPHVLRVFGHAPAQALLQVRVVRSGRLLARRVIIVQPRDGHYGVHLRLPRRAHGTVHATVSATLIGGRKLRVRTRAVAIRR